RTNSSSKSGVQRTPGTGTGSLRLPGSAITVSRRSSPARSGPAPGSPLTNSRPVTGPAAPGERVTEARWPWNSAVRVCEPSAPPAGRALGAGGRRGGLPAARGGALPRHGGGAALPPRLFLILARHALLDLQRDGLPRRGRRLRRVDPDRRPLLAVARRGDHFHA